MHERQGPSFETLLLLTPHSYLGSGPRPEGPLAFWAAAYILSKNMMSVQQPETCPPFRKLCLSTPVHFCVPGVVHKHSERL